MEEVEEMKCEESAWAIPSCWKPADPKKLATAGRLFHLRVIAVTILDLNGVDAGDIEQCKCYRGGWVTAGVFNIVTELMQHA